jgi:hypothetical protein
VINGVVSLWKTDNMDQGNIIYVWSSLENHGHNSKFLTILLDDKFLQDIRYTYDDNFHLLISICTQLYGCPYICRDTVGFKMIFNLSPLSTTLSFFQQIHLSLLTQFQKKRNCRRRSSQSLRRIRGRPLEG